MKVLIFGGSFNPLHNGHLFIAEEAKNTLGYDKVVFVPSNISSHKEDNTGLDPEIRFRMLEKELENYPDFFTDRFDIDFGGVSYTINTVEHFYKEYSFEGKPGFIIGDDLLPGFSSWKNVDHLAEKIDLVVVRRDSAEKIDSEYPDYYIDNTLLPISSTEIRNRIKAGKSVRFLVPDSIREIIEANGYYR